MSVRGLARLGIFRSRHSFFKCKSSGRFTPDALRKSANRVKRLLRCASVLNQRLEFATFKQTGEGDMRRSEERTRTKPIELPLRVVHFLVF